MHKADDIRDLIGKNPPINPGRDKFEEKARVALPGDRVDGVGNSFVGHNPQNLVTLLRSGTLSPKAERQVRHAIKVHETFSGERMTGGLKRLDNKPPSRIDPDVIENKDRDPELEDFLRRM